MFQKEVLENWRNFKWIWVPLVFILLATIDPITLYYMPMILDKVGGLPDGAIIEFPDPTSLDVLQTTIGQMNSLGILIIVLLSMGTIAGEHKSGVSEMILVKPIHFFNYLSSKWATLSLIVLSSLFIGFSAHWYYVNLLFDQLSFQSILIAFIFYGLWYMFILTLVIFYSSFLSSVGMIAALTIATTILLSIVSNLFGKFLLWSPNHLQDHIVQGLQKNELSFDLWMTTMITILLIIGLLFLAYTFFKKVND